MRKVSAILVEFEELLELLAKTNLNCFIGSSLCPQTYLRNAIGSSKIDQRSLFTQTNEKGTV